MFVQHAVSGILEMRVIVSDAFFLILFGVNSVDYNMNAFAS